MLTRIVLDYTRDEYVFPDGRVVARNVPRLFDSSFSLKVRKDANLSLEVAKLLETQKMDGSPTHFQAYEVVGSEDGKSIQYAIHFLRFTGEAHSVEDETIRREQAALYRRIAG